MNEKKTMSIKELKRLSRGQLIGKYTIAIIASLIITSLNYLILMIEVAVLGDSTTAFFTGLLIDLIVSLLFGIFTFGESYFFLKIARHSSDLSIGDIFIGFKGLSDRAILIQSVFTLLSFLGNIPSILMAVNLIIVPDEYYIYFNYGVLLLQALLVFFSRFYFGLAFYVLADHQSMSALDALKESVVLMKKQKGRLLLVYLSSIPLALVSIMACGVGFLWFNVYFNTLLANFYLDTTGEKPYAPGNDQNPTAGPSDDSPTLDIRL